MKPATKPSRIQTNSDITTSHGIRFVQFLGLPQKLSECAILGLRCHRESVKNTRYPWETLDGFCRTPGRMDASGSFFGNFSILLAHEKEPENDLRSVHLSLERMAGVLQAVVMGHATSSVWRAVVTLCNIANTPNSGINTNTVRRADRDQYDVVCMLKGNAHTKQCSATTVDRFWH